MATAAPAIEVVTLPTEGFVRLPVVLKVYPVSARTWWRGVQNGTYPAPVKLTPHVTAWRVEDIRALLIAKQRESHS